MDDLLVECPIHLDAVSVADILAFRCGHGFCEPCLEEHFAHHEPSHLSCPTCRKPVKRKEAFPLFLTPARPEATQSSRPTAEAPHKRLKRELKEARAAHANVLERFTELQHEIDNLRQDEAYHNQTVQHLRGRYELLEERFAKEAGISARAREESSQMNEEVAKLRAENQKICKALEQALKEVQVQLERVKLFQGYIERYKRKCNLERKKRKAIESVNQHSPPKRENDSLMIVDANAPDILRQDGPDFGWLDEACKVRGDQYTIPGDENSELELEPEGEGEVQLDEPDVVGKQREDRAPEPPLRFPSDWNLGPEMLPGPTSRIDRKQRHESGRVGGRKFVKVKMPVGAGTRKMDGGPLVIDRRGHIKGVVALGPRQKLTSKN